MSEIQIQQLLPLLLDFLSVSWQHSVMDNQKHEGPGGGEPVQSTLEKEVGRETMRAWMNTDPWFLGHTPSHRTMSSFCSYGFLPFPLPFRLFAYHSKR